MAKNGVMTIALLALLVGVIALAIAVPTWFVVSEKLKPEQGTVVVGQVFFDHLEAGTQGYLDWADWPAGGGIVISIEKYQGSGEWSMVAVVRPNEVGQYRVTLPEGEYFMDVTAEVHISSVYKTSWIDTYPSAAFVVKGEDILVGPTVFVAAAHS